MQIWRSAEPVYCECIRIRESHLGWTVQEAMLCVLLTVIHVVMFVCYGYF